MEQIRHVVYIEREARLTMVFASIEAFRKETLGLLLGYRTPRNARVIRLAIPYQTAERSHSSVKFPRREPKLLRFMAEYMPLAQMEHLGYFHSHPEDSPTPSRADIDSTKEGNIEMIVAIKETTRAFGASPRSRRRITAAIGNYHYEIRAYYKEAGKLKPADLASEFEEYTV